MDMYECSKTYIVNQHFVRQDMLTVFTYCHPHQIRRDVDAIDIPSP